MLNVLLAIVVSKGETIRDQQYVELVGVVGYNNHNSALNICHQHIYVCPANDETYVLYVI